MLAVVIAEATPTNVHGVLSRWLVKIGPSTYVGHLSARVRAELWTETKLIVGMGRATLIYPNSSEQGFAIETVGTGRYVPLDLDGLVLTGFQRDHETITEP